MNNCVTFAGYTFFVDPDVFNSTILHDKSSYPDMEELKAEIAEIFTSDAEFSIESLMNEIRSEVDFSGSDDFGSDSGDSGDSVD